ncbi:hypothetical protein [Acinetobacter pollinis]|uniref:hypothetical protein n=1 Tax=Acinetobacter pollinis TaxID=2605270 RepID=UPI0018A32A13|nr:hypothetical protein [Acinetobacter pollinis]MBF7689359.1 hypothetical protein [Acinetobacter pollinis]MBF7692006.1 hypothetical protein [Acinetobacter pollinis]MBF7697046.1 hypothetical protein [Acinetobacter pollinis]MBF7700437.1 hypothetical protein [Acinetobacter pollinis]
MKNKILLILTPFLYSTGYAENFNTLNSNTIVSHYNENLNGNYPSLSGKQFKDLNKSIIDFISINFDTKDENYPTEVNFEEIFKNNEILSFSLNYNISNLTERYFVKYYVIDLNNKNEINLSEYLKRKNISQIDIVGSINKFIALCHDNKKKYPDYCSDMALQSLLENTKRVNYSNFSSFFVKGNSIGIAINSSKFTSTFIYNQKSKHVSLE